jgi:hypothetical protein
MHFGTLRRALAVAASALIAAACLVGGGAQAQAAASQPCDIYAAGGNPCVAAHSTTRALYATYNGPLYQVRRSSDNTTRDIGVVSAGGFADSAAQDSFCANTNCVITVIYDQSGRNNRLTQAPPGYWPGPAAGGFDNLADAKAAPITIGGHKAYGVYIAPGTGYRNDHTNGIATGDQPEGIYAVVDGTHYNQWCCFDYGNAQTDGQADSPAIMETVYFGADKQWGWGSGAGPWIMGDLEWGLFSGAKAGYNDLAPVNHRFVTAIVKGEPNHWSIRGGDAQSGGLTTYFDGPRPSGYNPMKKEGAIVLGTGGDNSTSGEGTFFEGVMTSGYPSAATEAAVQANITAAGYGSTGSTALDGNYQITNKNSGLVLDTHNEGTSWGTLVNQNPGDGGSSQTWKLISAGSGLYKIQSQSSGLYLGITDMSTSDGGTALLWGDTGTADHLWQVVPDGTGYYKIINNNSHLLLGVQNMSTSSGAQILQWDDNGTADHLWRLDRR